MKASRRRALQTLVSLPVLGHDHEPAPAADTAPQPKFFTEQQLADLGEWTDLMLPGAKAAGVPLLLDFEASRRPETAKRWKETLAWLNKASARSTRSAVLERISKETSGDGARHFDLLKRTTIDIYYSTREGLQQELGWNANTYLAEFPGCTHPEHKG